MPDYYSLKDQGFYEPFDTLRDALKYRHTKQLQDKEFALKTQEHSDLLKQQAIQNALEQGKFGLEQGQFGLQKGADARAADEAKQRLAEQQFTLGEAQSGVAKTKALAGLPDMQPPETQTSSTGYPISVPPPRYDRPWEDQDPLSQDFIRKQLIQRKVSASLPEISGAFNSAVGAQTGTPVLPNIPPGLRIKDLKAPGGVEMEAAPSAALTQATLNGAPLPGFAVDSEGHVHSTTAPGQNPNEDQNKAAGFASRMARVRPLIEKSEQPGPTGQNPSGAKYSALSMLPAGSQLPEMQARENAQKDWVLAKLRRESGANITPAELAAESKLYFPQYGNSVEEIARRAAIRRGIENDFARAAGPTFKLPEEPSAEQSAPPQSTSAKTAQPQKFKSVTDARNWIISQKPPPGTIFTFTDENGVLQTKRVK